MSPEQEQDLEDDALDKEKWATTQLGAALAKHRPHLWSFSARSLEDAADAWEQAGRVNRALELRAEAGNIRKASHFEVRDAIYAARLESWARILAWATRRAGGALDEPRRPGVASGAGTLNELEDAFNDAAEACEAVGWKKRAAALRQDALIAVRGRGRLSVVKRDPRGVGRRTSSRLHKG